MLHGRTVALRGAPTLPHIGWNNVERQSGGPLFERIAPGAAFYFVHSFVVDPVDPEVVTGWTEHGTRFPAAIARGALLGVQFHPERSGTDGLRVLANFVAIASDRGVRSAA